ncbi:hypothetical protein [Magpiepox virus 2]|nr:hypothetical protein [Magpiepox virus 2]
MPQVYNVTLILLLLIMHTHTNAIFNLSFIQIYTIT